MAYNLQRREYNAWTDQLTLDGHHLKRSNFSKRMGGHCHRSFLKLNNKRDARTTDTEDLNGNGANEDHNSLLMKAQQ